MMDKSIGDLVLILVSAMLVTNFTLFYFLGLCPFMGVSAKVGTALRMGLANIFVMTITSLVASFLNQFVLPHAPYLQTISFIVVIASLVQIVEMTIKKFSPTLFQGVGDLPPPHHDELCDSGAGRVADRTRVQLCGRPVLRSGGRFRCDAGPGSHGIHS